MVDIVPPEVRSRLMAGIRGSNTQPEIFVRKALHAEGFRFRIHVPLPGRPDIVFPKWKAVIFVHGCFWHGHRCHLFKWPKSRPEFWRSKIFGNVARDEANISKLLEVGWRVGIVWECALKGRDRLDSSVVTKRCSGWLRSKKKSFDLSGDELCAGVSSPTTLRE